MAWIGSVIGKARLVREPFFASLHAAAPAMPVRETEVVGIEGAVWRAQRLAEASRKHRLVNSLPTDERACKASRRVHGDEVGRHSRGE